MSIKMIQESIKKQVEESILTKHLLNESGLSDIEEAAGLLIDAVNTSKKILARKFFVNTLQQEIKSMLLNILFFEYL